MLVLKPEDVSARMGESAQFYCQAKGDPPPAVVWSREQGPLPNGRYLESFFDLTRVALTLAEKQ